jgi:hypothetical protein
MVAAIGLLNSGRLMLTYDWWQWRRVVYWWSADLAPEGFTTSVAPAWKAGAAPYGSAPDHVITTRHCDCALRDVPSATPRWLVSEAQAQHSRTMLLLLLRLGDEAAPSEEM